MSIYARRVKGFCRAREIRDERRTRTNERVLSSPSSLLDTRRAGIQREPFCWRKYRGAKCRVFTRVRAPLREDLDRARKRGKLVESKGIITRHLVVVFPPFDFCEESSRHFTRRCNRMIN